MTPPNRKRLLFISPCLPDPHGTGWEQRACSFLLAYSKHFAIELWFRPTPDNPEMLRLKNVASICESAFAFDPGKLARNAEHEKDRLVQALTRADHVHLFRNPIRFRHRSMLWDIDEVPQELKDPEGVRARGPKWAERVRTTHNQFEQLSKTSRIIFASSPMENHPMLGEITAIPNCYATNVSIRPRANSSTLLFVGNMSFTPNVDAVVFFSQSILPLLPRNLRLRIVGRRPDTPNTESKLERLTDSGRVEIFYDVEHCGPHYTDALAAIVPLRMGGGTRIKILEAFAHHCPVVSTSKGCEGLPVLNGTELLIADSPSDFAAACVELAQSAPVREKLVKAAHTFLVNNNSQDVVERLLDAALRRAGMLSAQGVRA